MNINELIRTEFDLDQGIYYLNHAAVSPWPNRTKDAVIRFAAENTQYGARDYLKWLDTELKLRQQLKNLLNAPQADDIALLKNTSEALSVVAEGIEWQIGDNIVSSDEEFPSNRFPWLSQSKNGVEFREISISTENPEESLINACDEHTRLLTISSIQYGSGKRINLEKLGRFCHENQILFCVDAIQSLGVIPMDVQSIKADFVMADAHKWMLGPEGIAVFYCSSKVRESLKLHQFGWHMVEDMGNYDNKDWAPAVTARRFECGSPNMLGIHALSASLSLIEEAGIENISRKIINNSLYIIENISNISNIISPTKESELGGIVTFKIEGKDSAKIYRKLMKNNVICANRMGGIRFSPHFYTDIKIIDKSLEILNTII